MTELLVIAAVSYVMVGLVVSTVLCKTHWQSIPPHYRTTRSTVAAWAVGVLIWPWLSDDE